MADPELAATPAQEAPPSAQEHEARPDGPTAEASTPPSEPPPMPPTEERWRTLAAGAAGGAGVVIAAILVLAIWWEWPYGRSTDEVGDRLSAIETRFQDLSSDLAKALSPRPTPAPEATGDAEALAAVEARLERLEAVTPPSSPDPAMGARLGQFEAALQALSERLSAVGERADSSTAALGALKETVRSGPDEGRLQEVEKRLAAVENATKTALESIKTTSAELAGRAAATGRAVRQALVASALRSAVERHEPFRAELAAAQTLADDKAALASLEPFSETGLPRGDSLGRDLVRLIPQMLDRAGEPPAEGGFIERLQANAQRLVRVRPADEAPGSEPAAVLSRVEARAAQGDIAGALSELSALPDDVRAPAKDWIARAQARQRALQTARDFASGAGAALKPAP